MGLGDSTSRSADLQFSPLSKTSGLLQVEAPSGLSSIHQRRLYRQSAHLRPPQLLEPQNAVPTSPSVKDDASAEHLDSSEPDMSLFGLFSKPKVEKAHGYAEPGLAPPPSSLFTRHANGSRSELAVGVQPDDSSSDAAPRTPSAMSFFSSGAKPTSKPKPKDTAQVVPQRRKGAFDPPPLFQAYVSSMKHSALEVSSMTAETVLQKSKARRLGSSTPLSMELLSKDGADDALSVDTRRTARTTMRHVAQSSFTHVDLPRKIIVLVTSGFLLQYAESGPSERLPEKILQLGKDSAAFACDLIPGKHYVLQVSATVDQQDVVVANSGSIFSKLGLRSSAAKRMAKNLLLVLPSAAEMDSWMVAVRREIESLGGSTARSDMAGGPKTRDAMDSYNGVEQSPERSRRYQKKTNLHQVTLASEGSIATMGDLSPPSRIKDEDEEAETATLEEIEDDAAQLANEETTPSISQAEPDTQSLSSSVAVSMDQQRLNSLQSSHRASHATMATTIDSSRTNSISESLRSEHLNKDSLEASRDPAHARSTYRTLTSYAVSRRRSAMPAPREPLPILDVHMPLAPPAAIGTTPVESPVIGRNSELPALPMSPRTIGVAIREPDLRAVPADTKAKHDSKMSPTPFLVEESDRPESFVGDLPPPSTWTSERSPSKRTPALGAGAIPNGYQRSKPGRRQSTQPFSLPLKINPSTPANRPPSRHETHSSFNKLDPAGEEPTVHTLTAKIDAGKTLSVSPVQVSPGSPKPDVPSKHPKRTPSGRLSLFPAQQLPPTSPISTPQTPMEALQRSPSTTLGSNQSHSQANGYALKRPTSMQIRSDPAPFLKSVRSSIVQSSPKEGHSFTAPIRSLKPSRSSTYLASQPATPEPYTPMSSSGTFPLPEEEAADRAMPLPDRAASPLPTRPPSRASGRKMKTRSSLPELDLDILGPPAPPPQAPLPAPPQSVSRPVSPLPSASRSASPLPRAGLRIKV